MRYQPTVTLPMNTTSTAAKAAVAENISTLLAPVKSARATENMVVKTITRPIRTSMLLTKYKTRAMTVGRTAERAATLAVLMASIWRSVLASCLLV